MALLVEHFNPVEITPAFKFKNVQKISISYVNLGHNEVKF